LAALTAPPGDIASGQPVGELLGVAGLHLVAGQSLPVAQVALAQPGVEHQLLTGQRDDLLGGLLGPAQV